MIDSELLIMSICHAVAIRLIGPLSYALFFFEDRVGFAGFAALSNAPQLSTNKSIKGCNSAFRTRSKTRDPKSKKDLIGTVGRVAFKSIH